MAGGDPVRDEMIDLADRLSELDAPQWDAASLCAGWRIRDVLAHVVAGAEGAFGVRAVVAGMVRHGFNFNRWVAADGRARGQADPEVMVAALRNAAARRQTSVNALMHVVIHGQDMCRPLGIARELPATHVVPVANLVAADRHRFGTTKRIAGLTLRATDMEWSHGQGPEVTGPGEALVMMMAGRLVALHDLSGEGTSTVRARG
jgi:uncharacterized protein (TIGR03083 family)